MAKKDNGSNQYFSTIKEVLSQQVGSSIGKGMTQFDVVKTIASRVDGTLLAMLKVFGPAVGSATTESLFNTLRKRTGFLDGVDDNKAIEVVEAIFAGFFANLAKYGDNPSQEETKKAWDDSLSKASDSFGKPMRIQVVRRLALSSKVLDELEAKYGHDEAMRMVDWFNYGNETLAWAAFDLSTPARLASKAWAAADNPDFSDTAKVVTYVRAIERAVEETGDPEEQYEAVVKAAVVAIYSLNQQSLQGKEAWASFDHLKAKAFEWLTVNATGSNAGNVIRNWLGPLMIKNGQLTLMAAALWVVTYMVATLPWIWGLPEGHLSILGPLSILHLLSSVLVLGVLFPWLGWQAELLPGKPPPFADILPFKWHGVLKFRWQASVLPLATAVIAIIQRILGWHPGMADWIWMVLLLGISVGIVVTLKSRGSDPQTRGMLEKTPPLLVAGAVLGILVEAAYYAATDQLEDRGTWLYGVITTVWNWSWSWDFDTFIMGFIVVAFVVAFVKLALMDKRPVVGAAIAVVAFLFAPIVHCTTTRDARAANDVQEDIIELQQERIEQLQQQPPRAPVTINTTVVESGPGLHHTAPAPAPSRQGANRTRGRAGDSGPLPLSDEYELVCGAMPEGFAHPAVTAVRAGRGERIAVVVNSEAVPAVSSNMGPSGSIRYTCYEQGWIRPTGEGRERRGAATLTLLRYNRHREYQGGCDTTRSGKRLPLLTCDGRYHRGVTTASSFATRLSRRLPF